MAFNKKLTFEGLQYYHSKIKTLFSNTHKNISDEVTRATTAENTLTTNLNSEISRAKSAESTNATAISNEESRATTKENEIASNLSSHTSNTSNPHKVTKAQVGLGNVENKSSATIRGEITKDNVISALGYTPGSSVDNNTTYTLSKSGSTITLTGSDGSTTSVTDSDTNIDTKVTQTVTTSNASYPLLLAPSGQTATTTTTSYFDSGVTLNPSTNTIAANVSGNSATATKLATARTISLTGSVTGFGTFDGSGNLSITTTTNHTHSYLPLSGGTLTGQLNCNSNITSDGYINCNALNLFEATTDTELEYATISAVQRISDKTYYAYLALGSNYGKVVDSCLTMYDKGGYYNRIYPNSTTGNKNIYLPSTGGTLTTSAGKSATYTSSLSSGSDTLFTQAGAYAMYSELNSNLETNSILEKIIGHSIKDDIEYPNGTSLFDLPDGIGIYSVSEKKIPLESLPATSDKDKWGILISVKGITYFKLFIFINVLGTQKLYYSLCEGTTFNGWNN